MASGNKCAVAQSPANTPHLLQPCDQFVNKKFQVKVRGTRDLLCESVVVSTHSIQVRFMCAIRAWQHITVENLKRSRVVTGLWPMKFDLCNKWLTRRDRAKAAVDEKMKTIEGSSCASRVGAVQQRAADYDIFNSLAKIVNNSLRLRAYRPGRALPEITMLLKQLETVNDILMGGNNLRLGAKSAFKIEGKTGGFPCGETARYLSHGDV